MTKQAKLTLRLEEDLIDRAKKYSEKTGKSVSRLVADYFRLLEGDKTEMIDIPPNVKELVGVLKGKLQGKTDYQRHIEEKYL